jgi:hypothetical protein
VADDYYNDPDVRARFRDFLGGSRSEDVTAHFVSIEGTGACRWYNPHPAAELPALWQQHAEVARSLWDRDSLLVDLDMEYVNFDDAAEPYRDAPRAFGIQRPIVTAIEELLAGYGIAPLHLISGRGHHFVWRLDRQSHACGMLAHLGRLPETVLGKYASPQPPDGLRVPFDLATAFHGLGLVMEYFAHRILQSAAPCEIPLELTAVEVGPIDRGREIVSLDVSEYGDPLHTRTLRVPFTRYLKPERCAATARDIDMAASPVFVIPLHEMDELTALRVMRDEAQVRALARRASTQIPEQSRGMFELVADYKASELARYHDYFYRSEHDAPERWHATYDRTPLGALPRCVGHILQHPNDLLLKPAGIQHVVRTLTAVGWHPRHIAGLIRSKYERDYQWAPGWFVYDAALRADFYARLFAGLLADALDPLIDFNCKSTEEKGYCSWTGCGEILNHHRLMLVDRVKQDSPRVSAGRAARQGVRDSTQER